MASSAAAAAAASAPNKKQKRNHSSAASVVNHPASASSKILPAAAAAAVVNHPASASSKILPAAAAAAVVNHPASASSKILPAAAAAASSSSSSVQKTSKPCKILPPPPAAAAAASSVHNLPLPSAAAAASSVPLPATSNHQKQQQTAAASIVPAPAKKQKLNPPANQQQSTAANKNVVPAASASASKHHQNPPPPSSAPNKQQLELLKKIRQHLQPDVITRGGIPDPQDLKSVQHFWSTRSNDVFDSFVPPGAPSTSAQSHIFTKEAQAFIRNLIQIEFDMAEADMCLSHIGPDTFVVDEYTGVPKLNSSAFRDIVPLARSADKEIQIDANMSSLAQMIESDVIGNGNKSKVPAEVEDGLLKMMKNKGYKRRYVILNHVCLVPIENRHDLNLRMYQNLLYVVDRLNQTKSDFVLDNLEFPQDWHAQVKANRFLDVIYNKGHYSTNTNPRKPHIQAWGSLKFNRNSSEHGLEGSIVRGKVEYDRTGLAKMLYAVFPMLMHSIMKGLDKVDRIKDLNIASLFKY